MYHCTVVFIHLCYWFICGIAFAMTQYKEEVHCAQRAFTSDLAHKSSPLIKLTHPIIFPLSFAAGSKQRRGWTCSRPSRKTLSGRWTGRFSPVPSIPSPPSKWTRTKQWNRGKSTAPSLNKLRLSDQLLQLLISALAHATRRQRYLSSLTMDKRSPKMVSSCVMVVVVPSLIKGSF